MTNNLVAAILDGDCDPKNPLVIELHCVKILIYWERIRHGYWNDSEWVDGVYEYTLTEIKGHN